MTQSTVDLWEVIAEPYTEATKRGARDIPFGQTFHDEQTARQYARALRRAGYDAEVSPVFATTPNLAAALDHARRFFEDAALADETA